MQVHVQFYSYFKDLTGCSELLEILPAGSTLGDLHQLLAEKFPKLASMQKSTLTAVGLEYRRADYLLQEGDQVALFPPVQGG